MNTPLKMYVRFLTLTLDQVNLLQTYQVTVTKTLEPDVNAMFSDQYFIEKNIDTLPPLHYLQIATSGIDSIALNHPALKDAVVSGSRGVFNQPMAQYVLGHVLSIYQHHRFFTQTQKDQQWRPSRHQEELQGKKVAVIGVGQLGLAMAKTFAFFGAKVHGFNRSIKDSIYLEQCFALTELEHRLQYYDVVVVTLALNSQTKGLISRVLIDKLNPQAIFINVSRDGVLDEEALVSALQQKKIRHAILDTFSQEPLPKTSPLWALDNVTLTPHISYTSVENLKRMFEALLTNIQLYRQNESLINQVK